MFEPDLDVAIALQFKLNYGARMGDRISQARWERLYETEKAAARCVASGG